MKPVLPIVFFTCLTSLALIAEEFEPSGGWFSYLREIFPAEADKIQAEVNSVYTFQPDEAYSERDRRAEQFLRAQKAAYQANLTPEQRLAQEVEAARREQLAIQREIQQQQAEYMEMLLDEIQQLRIRQAYPNNPAMWHYLYNNPRYIDYYLQDR